MVKVRQPEGPDIVLPDQATVRDLIEQIQPRSNKAVAVRVRSADGTQESLLDLVSPVERQMELLRVVELTDDDPDALYILRHSCAHVMAEAICSLWPQTKLVYGPPVEDGFYYDIDLDHALSPDDFDKIEAEMARIIKDDRPFLRCELPRDQGLAKVRAEGNPYKLDNAQRAEGDTLTFYQTGDHSNGPFEDLCRGPHLPSTRKITAFKLMSVAGAYYRGDASQKMLQRVYGTAWPSKRALADYLHRIKEAKKRDHRVVGKQLDLYGVYEEIGPGLIHWHPKGAIIRYLIESFWVEEHLKRGYQLVYTPHIASERSYQRSGHLEKYADMMYAPMDIDGVNYYLKPMNCPGHYMIYNSDVRSYRDLPIRMCELGTVYRYEPSGTLHGMLRVRGFTQDDAHTFCTSEQLPHELDLILELMDFMMRAFGYTYKAYLATRPDVYLGTIEQWDQATAELRAALERRNLDYQVDEGAGVFYAPKIDIKVIDSMGREWQGPTHQVDLQAADRFDITYVGSDNAPHAPVIIHRTVLGSMERFIGGLIEHYAGAFPLWLAPVQVVVATVSQKSQDYAQTVFEKLRAAQLRAELDAGGDKIGAKIRRATLQKVPYILVIGEKEASDGTVNVRHLARGQQGGVGIEGFIANSRQEVVNKALTV